MKKRKTIMYAIEEIFESSEKKNLKEIYEYVVECGFEDKGDITKHTIRGIVYKLVKTGKITHVSKGVYIKSSGMDSSAPEPFH